jgi:S-DNA-T family DNA segregation ATPase FtsK/SpoIIIE
MAKQQWHLPAFDQLLDAASPNLDHQSQAREQVGIIEQTLAGFDLPAQVRNIHYGPRLTQFSLKLEPGSQVTTLKRLEPELAVALAGALVEIREPSLGYPYTTVLVENYGQPNVKLRQVIDSPAFRRKEGALKVGLGLDTFGEPVVIDLAAMPHLLVGGTTGSGKSVCLNALIAGLLCTHAPETLRLLLIDPLEVEFNVYNGLPHLVAPLISRPAQVLEALDGVSAEIERRYQAMAQRQMRDISTYNQQAAQSDATPLPYLVVLIDNLFDLMLNAPKEVEQSLTRISQKARGAGIHLVLATLRAKVETISGAIKANFPGRIAFKVVDRSESQLILDVGGAENLLGWGDMLYKAPNTTLLQRVQGVYVNEPELNRLVTFWRN